MNYYAATLGPEGFGTYDVDWSQFPPTMTRVSRAPDVLLIPGFVDLHIHGAYGIDFMSASGSDMAALCNKLEKVGYEGFLPTTVTAGAGDVRKALESLIEHEMILGFHLEGPFISQKYPGAQPKSAICDPPMAASEWDEILDDPRLRIVTMAPELPHALELTSRLASRRVIVSVGHTNATYEEARRGFKFGASHATHTFNAMRGFHHREAGVLGYILANEGMRCELIYDTVHVSKDAAKLLIKCVGEDNLLGVSDSTMATGLAAGTKLQMWGHETIKEVDRVVLEDGRLAGSAISLFDVFRNLNDDFNEEIAIKACCINPRRALRLPELPRVYLELDKKLQIVGRRVLPRAATA